MLSTHVFANVVLSLRQTAVTADEEETEQGAGAATALSAGDEHLERSEYKQAAGQSDTASASGVAVTNYVGDGGGDGWMERPKRNLLVVIHPWCMLRKSGSDRQSEFPPPGFLERLKAKLLALQRESEEQQRQRQHVMPATAAAATTARRRRNNNQKIKCWIQYTAAVAAATAIGGPRAKTIATSATASHQNEPLPASIDFLSVRRRFASIAAAFENADG